MKPSRPLLRYHGSKWRIAPWVISHFPLHRIYAEPYGGAAGVLLRKNRSYSEVYNDLDGEVVNLFRVLRDAERARELRRLLKLTPFAREEFELSYGRSEDSVERARRMMFRSFAGHAGRGTCGQSTGFRHDSRLSGTTPPDVWMALPRHIKSFTERLQGVVIENRPAREIVTRYDSPETLFYIDPPYPKGTRDNKQDDYRHEMTDHQHRELADLLKSVQGKVVLSGYPCDLYDKELYPDWRRVERQALADGARKRTEVLWMNFDEPVIQEQEPSVAIQQLTLESWLA